MTEPFVAVARLAELADPSRQVVEVNERLIVLVRVGDDVFALDDVCTHDDGPLGEGELVDHQLICPRHGARFDVRDGRALSMPATRPTATHEVKIESGQVFVRLSS